MIKQVKQVLKNENFDEHNFSPTIFGLTPGMQKYIGDLKIVMFLD